MKEQGDTANQLGAETTVSRTGSIGPEAAGALKKQGFASVINLRLASEPGADISAQEAAATTAGVNFVHIPFSTQAPDPAAVEAFLDAVTAQANAPAFIHCRTGNRAAALWAIKRVQIDRWSPERALAEAAGLGLTNPTLKQFALEYIRAHRK